MKNKFLEQKERGETILFTELLKEIPDDDILLELLSDQAPCMISFLLASQASRDSKVFSISAF